MVTQGAFTIILNENKDRVLFVRRKDFPIWDLPGGRVDVDEALTACAIREGIEETGYLIHIDRKIGEYHRPKFGDVQHIFLGKVVGGQEIKNGDETSKIRWFKIESLPLFMVPHRKEQIKDYARGNSNVVKTLKDSILIIKLTRFLKRH